MPVANAFFTDSLLLRVLTWSGIVLLLALAGGSVAAGAWHGGVITVAFAFGTWWLLLAGGRLPPPFRLTFLATAIFAAAGWTFGLFERVEAYDAIAHVTMGFAVTVTFGYLAYYPLRMHFTGPRLALYPLALATFGVFLGVLWEIGEWVFLGTAGDIMADLIMDALGALAGGLAAIPAQRRAAREGRIARSKGSRYPWNRATPGALSVQASGDPHMAGTENGDTRRRCEERIDETVEESFPASDPPSYAPGVPGGPVRRRKQDEASPGGPTSEQLRDDIDSGRTGDKVDAPDPAAAPLGTDDEAAGHRNDPAEIARMRRRERRR